MSRRERKAHDHRQAITVEELGRVLQAADVRERALWLTIYILALRASEPGLLLRSDWRTDRHEIFARRVKGSISATHRVPGVLARALTAWDEVRPASPWLFPGRDPRGDQGLSLSAVRVLWRLAALAAGLGPRAAYPHILKHSRCTHLRQAGARAEAVQQVAGHRSIRSTFHYFHATEEDERQVAVATDNILDRMGAPRPGTAVESTARRQHGR